LAKDLTSFILLLLLYERNWVERTEVGVHPNFDFSFLIKADAVWCEMHMPIVFFQLFQPLKNCK
jgi:hypothetical protein